MKSYHAEDEQQYWANLRKRIAAAFPNAGTTEDNLKPVDLVYRFKAECNQDIGKAIKIWHDIWLP